MPLQAELIFRAYSNMHATVIENLIEKFEQLPGIGRKSAERIAFHILEHMSKEDAVSMSNIITEAKEKITLCPVCQNLTDTSPCKYVHHRNAIIPLYVLLKVPKMFRQSRRQTNLTVFTMCFTVRWPLWTV